MTREEGIIKAYTENGPAVKAKTFPATGRQLIDQILDTEYENYATQCELYWYEQPLPKNVWLSQPITPKSV